MKNLFLCAAFIAAVSGSQQAAALALGAAELKASQALGCVLAEDALGYLSEEQFNERFDGVVEGFGDEAVDVIYAKALGYIDGLLFGMSAQNETEAMLRLQSFSTSRACSRPVNVGVSL